MFLLAINHKEDLATVIPTGDRGLIGMTFNCRCSFIAQVFNTLEELNKYVSLYYPECSVSLELFVDTQRLVMEQCPDLSVSERDQIVETLANKSKHDDLAYITVDKFIDSDPDSDLSCDLYQIAYPESYAAWLNSGLSRSQFVEKTYYLA